MHAKICRIGSSYPNHLDWLGCDGVLTQGPVVFLVSVIVLVGTRVIGLKCKLMGPKCNEMDIFVSVAALVSF